MPEVVLRFPEGRYEGEVDEKKVPNGEGCLEFPGNDDMERQIYEGGFKDKMAHGKGIMRWRNGDKYDGEFLNGLRHGKGTYLSKVRNVPFHHHKLQNPKIFFSYQGEVFPRAGLCSRRLALLLRAKRGL